MWYLKYTFQYLLSPVFLCVVPYRLRDICLHRRCVYHLRKSFLIFNDTCCDYITLRGVFYFSLSCCKVKISNWFKKFLLYSRYRSSNLFLFCDTSSKFFFDILRGIHFSSICLVNRYDVGHMELVCTFFIALYCNLASSNFTSISLSILFKSWVRLVSLINLRMVLRLMRFPVTFP